MSQIFGEIILFLLVLQTTSLLAIESTKKSGSEDLKVEAMLPVIKSDGSPDVNKINIILTYKVTNVSEGYVFLSSFEPKTDISVLRFDASIKNKEIKFFLGGTGWAENYLGRSYWMLYGTRFGQKKKLAKWANEGSSRNVKFDFFLMDLLRIVDGKYLDGSGQVLFTYDLSVYDSITVCGTARLVMYNSRMDSMSSKKIPYKLKFQVDHKGSVKLLE
ncbi:MAG: hypothetical protein WCL71_16460 [Deltaproteobacteria bacterium]